MSEIKVKDLDAILLLVVNPKASRHFYGELLGLKKIFEDNDRVMYDMGGTRLLLHPLQDQFDDLKDNYEGGWGLALYLEVAHLDKTITFLRDQAVEIFSEPKDRPWGVRDAAVRDPDGYYIYFTQHSEGSWKKQLLGPHGKEPA